MNYNIQINMQYSNVDTEDNVDKEEDVKDTKGKEEVEIEVEDIEKVDLISKRRFFILIP